MSTRFSLGMKGVSHLLARTVSGRQSCRPAGEDWTFDYLARSLADGVPRRVVLRRLIRGLTAALLAPLGFGVQRAWGDDCEPSQITCPPDSFSPCCPAEAPNCCGANSLGDCCPNDSPVCCTPGSAVPCCTNDFPNCCLSGSAAACCDNALAVCCDPGSLGACCSNDFP